MKETRGEGGREGGRQRQRQRQRQREKEREMESVCEREREIEAENETKAGRRTTAISLLKSSRYWRIASFSSCMAVGIADRSFKIFAKVAACWLTSACNDCISVIAASSASTMNPL